MRDLKPKGETRLERMERWFRNEPIVSVVMLLGISVVSVSEVVKHASDLLIAAGFKQEKTLELAKDTAKAEFSRRLVELAWRRLFWTRNFVRRVELSRPSTELDYSWNKYLDSVADWSAEMMVNINGLEQYYGGTEKPSQFNAIQAKFLVLEDLLVKLRSAAPYSGATDLLAQAKALIDDLNSDLYYFALNRHASPTTFSTGACKVTVSTPRPEDNVGSVGEVRGAALIPGGTYLWVLSHPRGLAEKWWPQGTESTSIYQKPGEWATIARYGAAKDMNQEFEIAVVVVDGDTNARLREWLRVADSANYPPIPFPRTVEGCPPVRVTVNRNNQ